MARLPKSPKTPSLLDVADLRHDDKRLNNPPAALAGEKPVPLLPKTRYEFSAHRTPQLQFDPQARLENLLEKSAKTPLTADEVAELRRLYVTHEPWLEWAGKREKRELLVDPVALHIHERVSAQAILKVAQREAPQKSLFADPEQDYSAAISFYQHEVDWANRLILGDSLSVMSSLAQRENLAGQVQMMYFDPPYGIKFASNFQPKIGQRDVKDQDKDLTREPETVRAFRDTWELGIHSYLTYLRDRLTVARELLHDSGSIFVQISDENLHRVRALMDEVFGPKNFIVIISVKKTGGKGSRYIDEVFDYILWYGKDADKLKYRPLLVEREVGVGKGTGERYDQVEMLSGERRALTATERTDPKNLSSMLDTGKRLFQETALISESSSNATSFEAIVNGQGFFRTNWKTNRTGFQRLINAERVTVGEKTLRYIRYHDDFVANPLANFWDDTGLSGKVYVVQTAEKVVARCILMTTDPGDLVLDPTGGSGTTAYVAEQWGRRWITCDTSRVALAIARQRILTARFDQYKLRPLNAKEDAENVKGLRVKDENGAELPPQTFECKTVPHIMLRNIAQNSHLDPIFEQFNPQLDKALKDCNAALKEVDAATRRSLKDQLARIKKPTDADKRRLDLPEKFEHWTVPFDTDESYPVALKTAVENYRKTWRTKMDEVNACIADNADSETLYDKPEIVKGVVRVSGPFTVEAVQPPEMSLDEPQVMEFDGAPEELDTFTPPVKISLVAPKPAMEVENVAAYLENLLSLLRADGLTFPGNKKITFSQLDAKTFGSVPAHADGEYEWIDESGEAKTIKAIISFGPQYGPISSKQVEEVQRSAYRLGYDAAIFAGFAFDDAATSCIESGGRLQMHMAQIRPDVNPAMDGLLKDTPGSQLFTVFGSPRINLKPAEDNQWQIEMEGMDIFDPVTNEILPTNQEKVAAWFLDSDYDGRTFCITQAFFPDKSAWDKLDKALKGSIDVSSFTGILSLPFPKGQHGRAAVKVIDPRGNEVMKVVDLV
jgi:adenine-specific DNA-methyltransferase